MLKQKLVSKKDLKAVYGIPYSFQHIARLEQQEPPGFPKRLVLGQNRVAWLCSEDCSFSTGAVFDLSGGRATY